MKTIFIGSNFYEHDSSVFIVDPVSKDTFAISTERLTRWKHDKLFAIPALESYIRNKKIDVSQIERIYFANTFLSREHESLLTNAYELACAERKHYGSVYIKEFEAQKALHRGKPLKKLLNFLKTASGRYILKEKIKSGLRLTKKVSVEEFEKRHLQKLFPKAEIIIDFFDHQTCHAISSHMTSPYENSLLFSYDGWGDNLFSRVIDMRNDNVTPITSSACPKIQVSATEYPFEILASPAGIYAYFTHLLGYKPTSEEGKVEALAAFGNYNNNIYADLITLFYIDKEKKSLCINPNKTDFLQKELIKERVKNLKPEDVAAAVQKFLEYTTHEYLAYLKQELGFSNICLSGGAAANVIMNLNIFEHITPSLHITPAMADDGTSQGAAILSLMKYGYSLQDIAWLKGEKMPYYGTSYTKQEVLTALSTSIFKDQIEWIDLGTDWPEQAAVLVAEGKVGAIFHGKMEWGPRALGNRSIIADPRIPGFREKINKTIKKRPLFQPFCPSILEEEKDRLFESAYLNKHMTCAFRMKKEFWDKLPSAIHIDGTARAQFVGEKDNPNYFRLLKKVKELTGYGIVINTSFNKHGRTIVETPDDAILDFIDTDMDYVVIEGIKIIRKSHVV